MNDRYAVMGNPIAHSLSPLIHKSFAEQTGENLSYEAILVPTDNFDESVKQFQKQGGKGLNITAPFKKEAYRLSHRHSVAAQTAQAVNTIRFEADGCLYGDNTDGEGFIQDVTVNEGGNFKDKRILLLGAGGAIRGLLAPLIAQQPNQIVIANRTEKKAEALCTLFCDAIQPTEIPPNPPFSKRGINIPPFEKGGLGGISKNSQRKELNETSPCKLKSCALSQLAQEAPFDWIINGTIPSAQIATVLPAQLLAQNGWCYDLVYGNPNSSFLIWAKAQKAARVLDGIGFLVEQAALSFYLWRGIKPQTQAILKQLRQIKNPP